MSPLHRPAFTLIELLVTIAIVAVLAGLLMPALGTVRDSARRAGCGSHLRILSMGAAAYAVDNAGYLVPSRRYFAPGPAITLREMLDPYVDTGNANPTPALRDLNWVCPGRKKRPIQNPQDYGGNLNVHVWWEPAWVGDAKKQRPMIRTRIRNADELVAFADVAQASGAGTGIGIIASSDHGGFDTSPAQLYDTLPWAKSQLDSADPDIGAYYLRYRHSGGTKCQIAFVDGHVTLVPRNTLAGRNFFSER